MNKYSNYVKEKLISIIKEIAKAPEAFVKNPGKDFVINRKLSFETMMKLLLSMGGNNIYKELLDYFNYDIDIATASAFVQQRAKYYRKRLNIYLKILLIIFKIIKHLKVIDY